MQVLSFLTYDPAGFVESVRCSVVGQERLEDRNERCAEKSSLECYMWDKPTSRRRNKNKFLRRSYSFVSLAVDMECDLGVVGRPAWPASKQRKRLNFSWVVQIPVGVNFIPKLL